MFYIQYTFSFSVIPLYMLLRLVIILGVLLLSEYYFFVAIKTISETWQPRTKTIVKYVYWVSIIIAYASLVYAMVNFRTGNARGVNLYVFNLFMLFFILKFIIAIPLLLEDITRLVRYAFSYTGAQKSVAAGQSISRSQFLSKTAVGFAAIPFGMLLYGMVKTAFDYSIKRVTIKLPNLPASFDGFTIVQISDLHTGSFTSTRPYERAVKMINDLKGDVVFMTGDLVNNVAEEATDFVNVLKQIQSPNGVYSILGNHDYGDYVTWESSAAKAGNLQRVKDTHGQMGWKLLLNENVRLTRGEDSIALLGVENWGAKHGFPKYGIMEKAYKGVEDAPVKLLLSHDPSHWDGEVIPKYPDIDVTFSGHTHGFQIGIEIPGFKWSPSQYLYKQWGGLYQEGKQYIYVNRGLGFLGYAGRVGIPPEITVIQLKRG